MLDWFEANPHGFSIIKSGAGDRVGNLDILPIKKSTLRRLVAGEFLERDITGDCLYGENEREKIEDLYIESFVVDPASARSAPAIIIDVLSNFSSIVNRICSGSQIQRLYAIAASEEGSGLLVRLGFESVGKSDARRDGHQLYLGNMELIARSILQLLGRRITREERPSPQRSDLPLRSEEQIVRTAPADESVGLKPELASVFFLDIVAFTQLNPAEQVKARQMLESSIQCTEAFRKAIRDKLLVARPTGDGLALIFFAHPCIAAECAVQVAKLLHNTTLFNIRMGINQGTVYRLKDINGHDDVSGSGINIAQRVMDCGDSGHILVSASVADALKGTMDWHQFIRPIGRRRIKHGDVIEIHNLCGPEFGQSAPPKPKVRSIPRHP